MMKQLRYLIFLLLTNILLQNTFIITYFKNNIKLVKNENEAEIQTKYIDLKSLKINFRGSLTNCFHERKKRS